jgi:RHS repeat-associated protein
LIEETSIDEMSGETHALSHEHDALDNRTQTTLPELASLPNTQRALNYLYYGSGHLHQVNLSHARSGSDANALASAKLTQDGARGNAETIHQLICDIERDDLHREIARTQGGVTTRYAHDAVGRRTGAWTQASAVRGGAFKTTDLAWQRTLSQAIGQPVGNSGEPSSAGASALSGLMKDYSYDLVGELRSSISSLKGQTHHRYDATGRVEETHRLSKGAGTVSSSAERFGYDPAGNILDPKVASKMAVDQGSQSRQQRGYVRDNRVRVFEDKRYAYDGHGRLIEKKIAKHTVQRFEWDDEHRMIAVHSTRHANDEKKRFTQTTRFDYDAIGRRVAKHDAFGTTRFIWEGMRLIEERRGSHIVSYVYEPNSYVPLARIDASGAITQAGGIAHSEASRQENKETQAPSLNAQFAWASTTNQSPVAKLLKTGSSPDSTGRRNTELVAANDPISRHSRPRLHGDKPSGGNPDREDLVAANDDWDALLAPSNLDAKQATYSAHGEPVEPKLANVYYFHTDQVGLPEELSDSQGNIRWRASYKTWGSTVSESWETVSLNGELINPLIANDPSASAQLSARAQARALKQARKEHEDELAHDKAALEQNLRFQGQYLDRDTGLHYNTFRYYDADIGRFISPDPIGLEGGHNLQSYSPNPLNWTDPLGWANRPNNGNYHIKHDYTLPAQHRYSSDAVQFNRANQDFINRMNNDPAYRQQMLRRNPELSEWMKTGNKAGSPPGHTWHHHEQTNRLVLVSRKDHQSNHKLYHPTGKGGRDIWGGGKAGREGKLNGATGKPC